MERSRVGWVVASISVAVGALAPVGCGGDESPQGGSGLKCGAGTKQVGSECVSATTNAGGDAGSGGSSTGGSSTASGGSGGGTGGAGGGTDGGPGGTGGKSVNSGGISGDGGPTSSGGAGGDDSGNTTSDSGSPPPPPAPTRWLAFQLGQAAYAYDLNAFTTPSASVKIGTGLPSGPWSPDGQWILHYDTGGLYSRDMSGAQPATPILLGTFSTGLFSSATLYWSGDSRSLSFLNGGVLSTLDARTAAPLVNQVATNVTNAEWAPRGNKLLYANDTGVFVVDVVAGKPGSPVSVGSPPSSGTMPFYWSPTGTALAATVAGHFEFIDLRGTTPVKTDITETSSADSGAFDYDGARAWVGVPDGVAYLSIGANGPGPLRRIYDAPDGSYYTTVAWAPRAPYLFIRSTNDQEVIDLGGSTPGTLVPVPAMSGVVLAPKGTTLAGSTATGVASFDFKNPSAGLVQLTGASSYDPIVYASDGLTVGFQSSNSSLTFASVAGGSRTDFTANPSFFAYSIREWSWSPDAAFVAFTAATNNVSPIYYTVGVMRSQGTTLSAAVYPLSDATGLSSVWFEP